MGFLIPLQLAPIIPPGVKSLDGVLVSFFGTPVPYSVVNGKSYIQSQCYRLIRITTSTEQNPDLAQSTCNYPALGHQFSLPFSSLLYQFHNMLVCHFLIPPHTFPPFSLQRIPLPLPSYP